MKEEIDALIIHLIAVKEFSKDIHYTAHGEAFYAKHLLVDKFDWDGHIDLLKECCLLGRDERPQSAKYYLQGAQKILGEPEIKDDKQNFINLLMRINGALEIINKIDNTSKADDNVLGNIAQDLQQYKGLINLQIEE